MLTEVGPVDIAVPRDRDACFAPVTVPKRVRRLRGVDEMVVSLVARGMTTGDVQAHLAEVYGTSYEDIGRRVPDVSKMQRVLGVRAETLLADGLRRTVEWFQGPAGNPRAARRG